MPSDQRSLRRRHERAFCVHNAAELGQSRVVSLVGESRARILQHLRRPPTGLALEQHIFIADKSDYYVLNDDLPKLDTWQ